MDREKRRSAEDELELDRKIALIREKNLKLEQRLKEVEEDRVRDQQHHTNSTKTSALSKPVAEKKSGREWDKGKTPASTWRENVPSIDLKGKLASQKKSNNPNMHNTKIMITINNNNNVKNPKIPSRLEGRVSFVKDGGSANSNLPPQKNNKKQQQPVVAGGGDQQKTAGGNQKKREKRQPKVEGVVAGQNVEQNKKKENIKKKDGVVVEKDEIKKTAKKPRARRESDNYAVKQVVRGMIDKICWLERLEKRQLKKEAEELLLKKSEVEVEAEKIPEPESTEKIEEQEKKEEDANQNLITAENPTVVSA
ncbi:unnamed protein product [Caenorhabditis angaria]|uniref:Uncharacterized protein n=1 Tax=Caenorhabditis angaria TaxID=860376 RepID=A0A9P1N899_9PELO|nr:unnamed protein product [Caenorhabditis angaria]